MASYSSAPLADDQKKRDTTDVHEALSKAFVNFLSRISLCLNLDVDCSVQ